MNAANKTQVEKNLKEKTIRVSREFNAPLEDVWRAHTEKELLDQWWGPQPWRAETKTMHFAPGGHWLYAMVGPQNEKHWARMDYKAIVPHQRFEMEDYFCDENGNLNPDLPVSKGSMTFTRTNEGTRVEFKTTYGTEQEVQKIVEMGFEQGIAVCLDQLEALLQKGI